MRDSPHSGAAWWVAGVLAVAAGPARAEEAVRLQERLAPDHQYQVRTRVQLSGSLTVPAEKGKPAPRPLSLTGESAIDYDERILTVERGRVSKTVRAFRRIDLERHLGDTTQKTTLRPSVRRVVLMRLNNAEVPFSPDGPLTWGEIDLLRTDVFTPALAGLLPAGAVRVGDRWKADAVAVQELTDLEHVDEGELECRLESVRTVEGRRQARVLLKGAVRGTNEDGPTRQELEGEYHFDLGSNHLAYLSLRGRHLLLDGDGKEMGKVEGRFHLTRQLIGRSAELSDESLRGVRLEPTAENTRLLYENADLGLSFLHPRRWRLSGVQGQQVTLDSADGSGVLLTVDPPQRVPTGGQLLRESRAWMEKQKARVLRATLPEVVASSPAALEHFAIEAEMGGQRFVMDYYVARQAAGGVSRAARLLPRDAAVLQKEVEDIARSIRLRKERSGE